MVKQFIARIILQATTVLAKSAFNAFRNIKNNQKPAGQAHPFQQHLNSFMQANNLSVQPMTLAEAIKILNVENVEDPEKIMNSYITLWKKNDPNQGGSFYIQCKIYGAKQFLMQEYQQEEADFMAKYEVDPNTLKTKQDIEDEQQEQEEEKLREQQQKDKQDQKSKDKEQK